MIAIKTKIENDKSISTLKNIDFKGLTSDQRYMVLLDFACQGRNAGGCLSPRVGGFGQGEQSTKTTKKDSIELPNASGRSDLIALALNDKGTKSISWLRKCQIIFIDDE